MKNKIQQTIEVIIQKIFKKKKAVDEKDKPRSWDESWKLENGIEVKRKLISSDFINGDQSTSELSRLFEDWFSKGWTIYVYEFPHQINRTKIRKKNNIKRDETETLRTCYNCNGYYVFGHASNTFSRELINLTNITINGHEPNTNYNNSTRNK